MECTKEHGVTEDDILFVEIQDDSYYEGVCPRGHRRAVVLTTRKFEILFQFGAMALIDGYAREAVASFAAGLERFYEYWVRVQLLYSGVTPEALDAAWKQISAQSERQLGAFVALYLREYGTFAPLLPQSITEFRNEVTHKGYIPTRPKALEYGDEVLRYMAKLYQQLYKSRYDGISRLDGIALGQAASRAPKLTATVGIATVFSEAASATGCSLETALVNLEGRMARIYKT
jgi:hypothetical protein